MTSISCTKVFAWGDYELFEQIHRTFGRGCYPDRLSFHVKRGDYTLEVSREEAHLIQKGDPRTRCIIEGAL